MQSVVPPKQDRKKAKSLMCHHNTDAACYLHIPTSVPQAPVGRTAQTTDTDNTSIGSSSHHIASNRVGKSAISQE